jgi:hypothetical protein
MLGDEVRGQGEIEVAQGEVAHASRAGQARTDQ